MSNNFKYDSYGNSIDGITYCSGVETFAQNIIEDNEHDASIIFPFSNGWATPRTEEYRLTDDSATMILSEKIYKLLKVYIYPNYFRVTVHLKKDTVTYVMLGAVKESNGNLIEGANIITHVVEQSVFNTLPTAKSGGINKGNVFYYNQGDNKINFGENIHKLLGFDIPNYISLFKKWAEEATENKILSECYIDYAGERLNLSQYEYEIKYFDSSVDYSALKVKDIKFRVEYIPITSDIKIRARKSAKTDVDYIQPVNQRAEVNSASALGKFLYNTAQKTGTEQITVVKWYQHLADIPPLGCRVRHNGEHYILTANSFEMTNCVQMKVTHTLSKNWSNKSQHVAIDQKYRNYKIPADILWRNLYWEDFVEISKEKHEVASENSGSIMYGKWLPQLLCNHTNDTTITSLFLTRKDEATNRQIGVVVPCSTLGIANSIIFTASMKDNLSAGLRMNPLEDKQYCEEVYYCDKDGKLKEGTIILADNIEHFNAEQYPYTEWSTIEGQEYYMNSPGNTMFRTTFSIDKDPGEALKFTYQCYFVSDDVDIVIGNKLTETHRLIKKWTQDRKFRFWRLTRPMRQGADKVFSYDGESVLIETDLTRERYWKYNLGGTNNNASLELGKSAQSYLSTDYAGWAITDENNNLYIGCNDVNQAVLYFMHVHKRN